MSGQLAVNIIRITFIIVFNILFFIMCQNKTSNTTILSYIIIHLAYLTILITEYFIKERYNLSLLSYTLYMISSTYFAIELLLGIFSIIFLQEYFKISMFIQIIPLGMFVVIFLIYYISNIKTTETIKSQRLNGSSISLMISNVDYLLDLVKADDNLNSSQTLNNIKLIKDLIYALPYSQTLKIDNIDAQISNILLLMISCVKTKTYKEIENHCNDCKYLLSQRNNLIKERGV